VIRSLLEIEDSFGPLAYDGQGSFLEPTDKARGLEALSQLRRARDVDLSDSHIRPLVEQYALRCSTVGRLDPDLHPLIKDPADWHELRPLVEKAALRLDGGDTEYGRWDREQRSKLMLERFRYPGFVASFLSEAQPGMTDNDAADDETQARICGPTVRLLFEFAHECAMALGDRAPPITPGSENMYGATWLPTLAGLPHAKLLCHQIAELAMQEADPYAAVDGFIGDTCGADLVRTYRFHWRVQAAATRVMPSFEGDWSDPVRGPDHVGLVPRIRQIGIPPGPYQALEAPAWTLCYWELSKGMPVAVLTLSDDELAACADRACLAAGFPLIGAQFVREINGDYWAAGGPFGLDDPRDQIAKWEALASRNGLTIADLLYCHTDIDKYDNRLGQGLQNVMDRGAAHNYERYTNRRAVCGGMQTLHAVTAAGPSPTRRLIKLPRRGTTISGEKGTSAKGRFANGGGGQMRGAAEALSIHPLLVLAGTRCVMTNCGDDDEIVFLPADEAAVPRYLQTRRDGGLPPEREAHRTILRTHYTIGRNGAVTVRRSLSRLVVRQFLRDFGRSSSLLQALNGLAAALAVNPYDEQIAAVAEVCAIVAPRINRYTCNWDALARAVCEPAPARVLELLRSPDAAARIGAELRAEGPAGYRAALETLRKTGFMEDGADALEAHGYAPEHAAALLSIIGTTGGKLDALRKQLRQNGMAYGRHDSPTADTSWRQQHLAVRQMQQALLNRQPL